FYESREVSFVSPQLDPSVQHKWYSLVFGLVKMNSDVFVKLREEKVSVGGLLCNHEGIIIAFFSKTFKGYLSVEDAELIAIRASLSWALQEGFQVDVFSWGHS
ncbi:hypothetical protein PanWU01x14_223560, partial [Parasponia andersonii]